MIELHEDPSIGALVLEVRGKLEHADYETLVPRLEAWLAEHGRLRCLVDMTGFEGLEARAIWDELRFDIAHAADVAKCAVLGNRRWEDWMTKLSRLIFRSAEVRYFDEGQREAAAVWLREGK